LFLAGTAAAPGIAGNSDDNTGMLWPAADTLAWATGGSERMRLDSSGNLGIGTSSPLAKLDVRGASGNGIQFLETSSGNTTRVQLGTASGIGYINADAGAGSIALGLRVGGAQLALLDSSGNLGLGVTPSAWEANFTAIQLKNGTALWNPYNGGGAALSANTARVSGDLRYIESGSAATAYIQLGGAHNWYTAPSGTAGNAISFSQVMTLDASGNLGIGATSPTSAIHASRASGAAVYLQLAQTGVASWQIGMSASSNGLAFLQSGSEKIRIKETGQLRYIPLAADPAGAENGDVYYNSTTNKLRVYAGGAWVDLH
jgi:hypothetical protein